MSGSDENRSTVKVPEYPVRTLVTETAYRELQTVDLGTSFSRESCPFTNFGSETGDWGPGMGPFAPPGWDYDPSLLRLA